MSESVSIPPTQVPVYVKQKIEEKHRLEDEIMKAGTILEKKNVVCTFVIDPTGPEAYATPIGGLLDLLCSKSLW